LRHENKVQFLGEFHNSKEAFLMGPIKKKGARSFGGITKNTKNTLVAPPRE